MPSIATLRIIFYVITALIALGGAGYVVHTIREGARDEIKIDQLNAAVKTVEKQNEIMDNTPDTDLFVDILRAHDY